MSTETYKPGDLAMVREPLTDDEPVLALFDGNAWYGDSTGAVWGQGAVTVVRRLKAVPADAIVLDKDDEDVQEFMQWASNFFDGYLSRLADKIAAQITPPEPPMEEPTALGEKVKTDNGVAVIADDQSGHPWYLPSEKTWHHWGQLKNPRPYESPRQEPATAPQSDAQGSGSGIGRVSESEASEGAQAHAEAWVEWGKRARGEDRP